MNDTPTPPRDYSATLFLPKTDFPMRAGLPQREPELIERWRQDGLYARLRQAAKGREKYILHDGPPYANGNIHIGTGLNKILKDVVVRSHQMQGYDAAYVPGWDCHGLPIEWKIEEQYRAKGKNKDEVPVTEFRRECREFAEQWIDVQREEFRRLGVEGDWANPYTTMSFPAEAQIARELMKFASSGQLYRGSKPVMWSVVEKTALAEAEVEYHEHESTAIWVKFPIVSFDPAKAEYEAENSRKLGLLFGMAEDEARHDANREMLTGASIVIWTTTPWTIPGNRAIAFAMEIDYGLYEVTEAPADNWAKIGDKLVLADALAEDVRQQARISNWKRLTNVSHVELSRVVCAHPFRDLDPGYFGFDVPVLDAGFVTDDQGTGFVHVAPGHGADDYELWAANKQTFAEAGTPEVPHTVAEDGTYFPHVPLFSGARVYTDKGKEGDANKRVLAALTEAGALIARGRLKHQYPHSWRSKAPLIFRNTAQWFISMGDGEAHGLRDKALSAIDSTRFVPPSGRNRLRGMMESRPDWVISRQRAWGVPITVFVDKATGDILRDEAVDKRIADAFEAEGADAWFADGAASRFLGPERDPQAYEQVTDILDVWFDSGSTHAFVLETRPDLKWPASLYLEGSDQHRGWFHSSLLESCGTRGRAPYDAVLTHGFVMAEDGRKMSKSLGNVVTPQDVIAKSGADILRLWVVSSDFTEDLRIGPEILKTNVEAYRKLRNTLRWMLGSLAHHEPALDVTHADMPELERYILARLAEIDETVARAYRDFDFKRAFSTLFTFMTVDLSAFYFDMRKDALYCDPHSSVTRRACLTVLDRLFDALCLWLAPMLPFTTEEAWGIRHGEAKGSVHLQLFPDLPEAWRDAALTAKWRHVRTLRRVVTGALEIERAAKRIGSSLEAAPTVYVADQAVRDAMQGLDLAEIAITSAATLEAGDGPADAFRLEDVAGIAVVPGRAEGRKCARSWKVSREVGADPDYPDITPRDAAAMREFEARAPQPA